MDLKPATKNKNRWDTRIYYETPTAQLVCKNNKIPICGAAPAFVNRRRWENHFENHRLKKSRPPDCNRNLIPTSRFRFEHNIEARWGRANPFMTILPVPQRFEPRSLERESSVFENNHLNRTPHIPDVTKRLRQCYIYAWTWTQAIHGDIIHPSLLTLYHPNPVSLLSPRELRNSPRQGERRRKSSMEEHHRRFQAATAQAFERIKMALRNNIVSPLFSFVSSFRNNTATFGVQGSRYCYDASPNCTEDVLVVSRHLDLLCVSRDPPSTLHQRSSNPLHNNTRTSGFPFRSHHHGAVNTQALVWARGRGLQELYSHSVLLGSGRGSVELVFVGGHVPAAGLPPYSSVERVFVGGHVTSGGSPSVLQRRRDRSSHHHLGVTELEIATVPHTCGLHANTPEVAQDVRIECNSHEIGVAINTKSGAFNGMIYPKGLSKNSSCMSEFVHQRSPVRYRLPLRSCNTMSTELLANALVVLSSTAEDGEIEVRISRTLKKDEILLGRFIIEVRPKN
uniref:(California timema) hypothetical protein n=1 Tax=Timema californicum TaxID=61474 RepID=A0A7R9IXI1_TIMCA|nr:unnamed protein product [Timema californicum]